MLAIVSERCSNILRHAGELFVDAIRWLMKFVLEIAFVELEKQSTF